MDAPESVGISLQWVFGTFMAAISGIIGYLFNWNSRIERKLDESRNRVFDAIEANRKEFKDELDRSLDRQTRQLVQLIDARLYPNIKRDSGS